jgi:D-glycero-D-manno-heptose 1,7-bisphosphate phosphatase
MTRPRKLLLLDRDGTLVEEGDYLGDPAKLKFISGVFKALKALQRAGYATVVVSNQSGIGRGLITRSAVDRVQAEFLRQLRRAGVTLEGYYRCPHAPEARCACRKPRLGLVKRAARDLGIPWKASVSVGDRASDVRLGQRTGGKGVLVLTGYGKRWERHGTVQPDHVAKNLAAAIPWLLKEIRKDTGI